MSLNMLVSLTNGGGTILLFLAVAWLILSFVLLKIIFFPGKKYLQRTEQKKNHSKVSDSSRNQRNTTGVTDSASSEDKPDTAPKKTTKHAEPTEIVTEAKTDRSDTSEPQEKQEVETHHEEAPSLTQALEGFSPDPTLKCAKESDSFWTYTAKNSDALEVGTAFADELQHLGYDIQSDTHETASATRDETLLTLHIEQRKNAVTIDVTLEEVTDSSLA